MRRTQHRPTATRAVARLVAAGLAAAIVIALGAFIIGSRVAESEALREAESVTRSVAHGTVEPLITDALLAGDPAALAVLDRAVRDRVLGDGILRVKVWAADGRVVYSDETRLIGERYTLGADEIETLSSGAVASDVSDLSRSENRFERSNQKDLEVYLPIRSPSGTAVLFETYQSFGAINDDASRIFVSFLPVLLGGLALLFAVQVPLAWRMARRLEHAAVDRQALLERAIVASATERRRIARDLHDGVVQIITGTAYRLAAVADRLRTRNAGGPDQHSIDVVQRSAGDMRAAVGDLRTLIMEISPPGLDGADGLHAALADLLAAVQDRGIDTHLSVDVTADIGRDRAAMLFRTAQELVRNAERHAAASQLKVSISQEGDRIVLVVADNGRGFDPGEVDERRREGHVGLDLLRGLLADADGGLQIESQPGAGSRVQAELPLR